MDGKESLGLCTHCGFTLGEYRLRGLLGCPHCYASFGEALSGDLLWIHEALGQDPFPGSDSGPDSGTARPDSPAEPQASPSADHDALERQARWREQLADAVRREDYTAAAALQKRIRDGEKPVPGPAAGGFGDGGTGHGGGKPP